MLDFIISWRDTLTALLPFVFLYTSSHILLWYRKFAIGYENFHALLPHTYFCFPIYFITHILKGYRKFTTSHMLDCIWEIWCGIPYAKILDPPLAGPEPGGRGTSACWSPPALFAAEKIASPKRKRMGREEGEGRAAAGTPTRDLVQPALEFLWNKDRTIVHRNELSKMPLGLGRAATSLFFYIYKRIRSFF